MGLYTDGKEILKDLVFIAKSIDNMDLKDKILEMQNLFFDLTDENRELRLENESLKNSQVLSSQLDFKNNGYFLNDEGPYCTRCWDAEHKLIRLSTLGPAHRRLGNYKCANCETPY